ncbi:MAG: energy transducer TonB [Methylococcaceae bacterium]|nr:energy transducer TonB [Methylococcaceae bacterium]
MKTMVTALLAGLLISLGLFWLMQSMLMSNQQTVKKSDTLAMMDFIRLKREPLPEKIKPKPPERKIEKVVEKIQKIEKVQKISKAEDSKPIQKVQHKPTLKTIVPITRKVETVKQDIPATPKLDIPAPTNASNRPVISNSASTGTTRAINSVSPQAVKGNNGTTTKVNDNGGEQGKGGGASSGVVVLERVKPVYPLRAFSRHIEGKVTVELTISTSGSVIDAVVVNAQPPDIFDDATLKAMRKWTFKPKIVDGKPVEQRAVVPYRYTIVKD